MLGFLKGMSLQLSAFVTMFQKIVVDLEQFGVVLLLFVFMFTNVRYVRHVSAYAPELSFHDDSVTDGPFHKLDSAFQAIYLMTFMGDYNSALYPAPGDKVLLDCFVMVISIVMLNVLIAIVSDSYDEAMATTFKLFWRERLELVTMQTRSFGTMFPKRLRLTRDEVRAVVESEMMHGDRAKQAKRGRIQDIAHRVQVSTRSDLARMARELKAGIVAEVREALGGDLGRPGRVVWK